MKEYNSRDIEDLYDRQVRDLTKRTARGDLKGYVSQRRFRQNDMDNFSTLRWKAQKRQERRRTPEDYEFDEDVEEWENSFSESR